LSNDERQLWRIDWEGSVIECVMVSCCSGAELQLRRDDAITIRELYPTKSDLYERANELKSGFARDDTA
jgi:hypothetical protein